VLAFQIRFDLYVVLMKPFVLFLALAASVDVMHGYMFHVTDYNISCHKMRRAVGR
jgi:hypothetical protein